MKFIIVLGIVLSVNFLQAQNIENILVSGKQDASLYLENYLEPIYNGVIYNLGGGWYHTGKTHKKFGFDISVSALASLVPDTDKTFLFKNADYTYLELDDGSQTDLLPTAMGQPSSKRIAVKIPIDASGNTVPFGSQTGFKVASFETLDGIENELPIAAIPTPMIQVGVGLPTKTDIKLRMMPPIGDKNAEIFLLGVGLQHDVLQHFIKNDVISILDLSVLGGFTTTEIKYTPEDSENATNQETNIKINAYTVQLVGNLDLKIINFYAGLGYVGGTATTKVKGDYTFTYNFEDNSGIPISGQQSETVHDPIDISYDLGGVKMTMGLRINAAWFKVFADYSIQKYNTANVGVSFSFR
jgi:hypothetical protein